MNPQLAGIEAIPGTYVFDLATSVRTLHLTRFFWRMTQADYRARFLADEEALYRSEGLSVPELDLVRRRDWLGLVRYGVNFFVLEKFARVVKLSNPDVYAAMRGETLEEFLRTRNVPDAR
jgi:protocatechuate 4,5-dioxygenase alpha chain